MAERDSRLPTIPDRAAYLLYKVFAAVVGVLPRGTALVAGRGVGLLTFWLDGKHRTIALDNLSQALGGKRPAAERRRIARRSFMNFVQSVFDSLKTAGWSREKLLSIMDIEGLPRFQAAHDAGRGVLLFTAHFGNWEMIVPPSSLVAPYHVIARAVDNPLINEDVVRARTRHGATVVNKLGAGRPVIRALGRGDTVGILIDQNVLRREAVFVDFFGKPAATTPALAHFHIRTGAVLLPMFCEPTRRKRYRVRFETPVEIPLSGRTEDDVLKITRVCTKIIEDNILRDPALWLWVHKRWQSRPVNER
jgi:Kdo2-lipid IVA lauroyltransferase/acyltransferase